MCADKSNSQPPASTPRLLPIPDWPAHFEWPSIAGLRNIRFYRATNGFEDAFVKIGGRVLVNVDAFFAAVARMNHDSSGK